MTQQDRDPWPNGEYTEERHGFWLSRRSCALQLIVILCALATVCFVICLLWRPRWLTYHQNSTALWFKLVIDSPAELGRTIGLWLNPKLSTGVHLLCAYRRIVSLYFDLGRLGKKPRKNKKNKKKRKYRLDIVNPENPKNPRNPNHPDLLNLVCIFCASY